MFTAETLGIVGSVERLRRNIRLFPVVQTTLHSNKIALVKFDPFLSGVRWLAKGYPPLELDGAHAEHEG